MWVTARSARSGSEPGIAPLIGYLALLTVAEIAVTFLSPVLVFPLHGGLLISIALYLLVTAGRPLPGEDRRRLTGLGVALVTPPVIRIISLTLPIGALDPLSRYIAAGVPLLICGYLAARAAAFSHHDLGLTWRATGYQVIVIAISLGVGVVEYAILRPAPLAPVPWTADGLLPAVAIGLSTGFPEELIFRGVMQPATRPFLGRWNVLYVSAVFAVLHIGYASIADVMFVFCVGLLYGLVAARTRSIIGVSIGHGLANVVLLCIAPNMLR